MSSPQREPMTLGIRALLALAIVGSSIVLPAFVVGLAAWSGWRDKGLSMSPSTISRNYWGAVTKGELWHSDSPILPSKTDPPIESRIFRLNLETGVKSDTGLSVPGASGWMMRIKETLYVINVHDEVFRQSGDTMIKLAALPSRPAGFFPALFLREGRLTTIRRGGDGSYRLVSLSDGKWIDGRPILLPETTRVWGEDVQRDRWVLWPRTSQKPSVAPKPRSFFAVEVEQQGEGYHLFVTDYSTLFAYRNGFEFADELSEAASALAPENAPREVTGWETIGGTQPLTGERWMSMTTSRDGLLFLSSGTPKQVARRKPDGTWDRLSVPETHPFGNSIMILADSAEDTAYILQTDQQWGSAEIQRITGDIVQPVHLRVAGFEREYLARWKRLGLWELFAWGLHIVLLTGGTSWLTRGVMQREFEFGNQIASLAPFWRRAVATSLDLALLAVAIVCFERFLVLVVGIPRAERDPLAMAHNLLGVEQALYSLVHGYPIIWQRTGAGTGITSPISSSAAILSFFIVLFLVGCIAKVFLEGRYGVTPGKWLLGLRTVRTTLRPCGFARALVRNLVYYADLPLLLTPLPAAIGLMFSDHRQRLGDRVADTIVVRAGTIREVVESGAG